MEGKVGGLGKYLFWGKGKVRDTVVVDVTIWEGALLMRQSSTGGAVLGEALRPE